jgi:hypothetical protein
MQLNYPLYLNRKSEVVNGTGNNNPWGNESNLESKCFIHRTFIGRMKPRLQFIKEADLFLLSKSIGQSIDYQIVT